MIPSNSNLSKDSCSPISSNCVVWQGRDIPCLNLCTGDSVSEVVYKLAEEVCSFVDSVGLSAVDLSVIITKCKNTPAPAKTLANVLNLLIDRIICVSDKVDAIPIPGEPFEEPTFQYPDCTLFTGEDEDILRLYVPNLAQKLCNVYEDLNDVKEDIITIQNDIDGIQQQLDEPPPTILSCISNEQLPIDELVEQLEGDFCDLSEKIGTPEDITTAYSLQCENLNELDQLMKPGVKMTSLPNWVTNPGSLSDSFANLWNTVCDMRAAIRSVLDNCCAATCDDIEINFNQKWSTDPVGVLLLNFKSKSKMINGFYDCGQENGGVGENRIFFTDAFGLEQDFPILLRHIDYPDNTDGFLDTTEDNGWIEFDLTGLDTTYPITATAELCFTNGSTQCIKCYSWTINKNPGVCCEVTATGTVTIKYKVCTTPPVVGNPYPTTGDGAVVIPPGLPQNIVVPQLPTGVNPPTTCNAPEVTVTLEAGQVFVVPKGAIVTFISDINLLTNTQCIPNLNDIPTDTTTNGGGTGGSGGYITLVTIDGTGPCPACSPVLNTSDVRYPVVLSPFSITSPHGGISGTVCVRSTFNGCTGAQDRVIQMSVIVNGVVTYPMSTVFNDVVELNPESGQYEVIRCVPVNASAFDNVIITAAYYCGIEGIPDDVVGIPYDVADVNQTSIDITDTTTIPQ